MDDMRRKALSVAVITSLAAFVATGILWVGSYRARDYHTSEVKRGGWVLVNSRGQLALMHHHTSPEPHGPTLGDQLVSLEGTWGTSTVYFAPDQFEVTALVKVLALDNSAGADPPTMRRHAVFSRPFFVVPVARGCHLNNGGGFGWASVNLPAYVPRARDVGPLFQVLAVPHWFVALLSGPLPLGWAWRVFMVSRHRRVGQCSQCGYDLRATPGRCPECGTVPAVR